MNKVILLGRLTKKPEIRYSQAKNVKVALFTLAVDRQYTKEGEERQADFFNIVAYSKLAEFAEKYLDKGIQICICGRLQNRSWEDNNGVKKYVTEIITEEINFADSFKKQETNENILNSSTPVKTENNEKTENKDDEVITFDDDLPF